MICLCVRQDGGSEEGKNDDQEDEAGGRPGDAEEVIERGDDNGELSDKEALRFGSSKANC